MHTDDKGLLTLVTQLSSLVKKWRIQADALQDLKRDKEIQAMILRNRKNADEVEILVGKVVSRQRALDEADLVCE
jgi:hypothetical protein